MSFQIVVRFNPSEVASIANQSIRFYTFVPDGNGARIRLKGASYTSVLEQHRDNLSMLLMACDMAYERYEKLPAGLRLHHTMRYAARFVMENVGDNVYTVTHHGGVLDMRFPNGLTNGDFRTEDQIMKNDLVSWTKFPHFANDKNPKRAMNHIMDMYTPSDSDYSKVSSKSMLLLKSLL